MNTNSSTDPGSGQARELHPTRQCPGHRDPWSTNRIGLPHASRGASRGSHMLGDLSC
jgi:hypothetical protein